jgi:hypothetical protein
MTQAEANREQQLGILPPERPERHVIVMPFVGVWNHPFKESAWTAKPGPVLGFDIKIEPMRWMGVRASYLRGRQPLEVDAGTLSKTFEVYQPTLDVTQLQIRVEPTLHLDRALSAYVGLGFGWGRVAAPEPYATPRLHSIERTGVFLAYEGALGIAYEPRVDRVVLDLSVAGSLLTRQTGTAYGGMQAFSDAGHRTTLEKMSQFSGAYRIVLGIGFIL